jgi:hypothetical protein
LGVGNWLAEWFEKLCLRRTQVLVLALATNPNSIANHATGARPVRACWGNSSGSSCSSRKRIGAEPHDVVQRADRQRARTVIERVQGKQRATDRSRDAQPTSVPTTQQRPHQQRGRSEPERAAG